MVTGICFEAVANLVDNAVKFTPAGGRNGENIVRVKDTGSGISEHERDAVLRPFYRSDKTRHTSGLGLGLNLVTAIVKLHGFRFTIIPGSGCVVEIACPCVQEPAKINSLVTGVQLRIPHGEFSNDFDAVLPNPVYELVAP